MKLLLCILALMSTSAYGVDNRNLEDVRMFFADIPMMGATPGFFKSPAVVQPVAPFKPEPMISDSAPALKRLDELAKADALAERVAAMETQIKSLQ